MPEMKPAHGLCTARLSDSEGAPFWADHQIARCLSDRELDVLRWTALGKTAWEVGEVMHLSERTVNFHIQRIVEKLGVPNKLAATVLVVRSGLI